MNQKQTRTMSIHFNDGTSKRFEFPAPVADGDHSLASRIKEALNARHLLLEADGSLVVIPVESIKYLKSFPAPGKLPAYAMRGGSFNEGSAGE
ncbi:MAG: hypothetical protein M3O62_09370 [Pseudomonadota bacterium]|nr:hypothetical protein [Pseudomonadota bacterium]